MILERLTATDPDLLAEMSEGAWRANVSLAITALTERVAELEQERKDAADRWCRYTMNDDEGRRGD